MNPPETPDTLNQHEYERLAALRHALRLLARATELAARQRGIAPQQYLLLLAIKGYPGRDWATITELAERLQLRHNAIVQLANRAASAGLVERAIEADPADRRIVRVHLTAYGDRVLQSTAQTLREERARVAHAFDALLGEG